MKIGDIVVVKFYEYEREITGRLVKDEYDDVFLFHNKEECAEDSAKHISANPNIRGYMYCNYIGWELDDGEIIHDTDEVRYIEEHKNNKYVK